MGRQVSDIVTSSNLKAVKSFACNSSEPYLSLKINKDILLPHVGYFIGAGMTLCFMTFTSQFGCWLCGDFSDNLSAHGLFISSKSSEVSAHKDLNTMVIRLIKKQISVIKFKPHRSIWWPRTSNMLCTDVSSSC